MLTVMVTGVGAIIGYGLLRSLRISRPDIRLIGCDIYPDAVGQAWCDIFEKAPYTSSQSYPAWLQAVLTTHHVDLLIPGIEQDVHYLSDHRDQISRTGCILAINSQMLINITKDKWITHQELAKINHGSRIPSFISGDYATLSSMLGDRFLLKPRRSYASKGLIYVTCKQEFDTHASQLGITLIAQPLVGTDDEEYTVSTFGNGSGDVCASITLQRTLARDGSTKSAWVKDIHSLNNVVRDLSSHFLPIGPTNFQFRRSGDQWMLLEINPRVSSSSSMRRAFGYNEAEMIIRYFVEGIAPVQPYIRPGFATRFIEDYIVYDRDHF